VQRQKELIEIKNKAITDNINYAQRIQSAILPDIKLIYKTLEQSFILFQPKDIVSGDFYAFAEKNDQVLIIAGDCTGHGVSGAFMSMIGSSLLNQIIIEKGIEEPAHILNHLNTAVIESLKQNVNESNDGMDISICSLNIKKLEMQYAGANRPLWLVRNNTLEVYKPDKFPIGGLQAARDRTFTNFKINLQKNDTIYIFTDGYADQFGGANGKKLMTSKFKEKLLSIQHMSMREQEMYLRAHFETWKGNEEQVDDVLVIGVRV
jgi:serine phosphatase RsbU (regulator of sigma subunit)